MIRTRPSGSGFVADLSLRDLSNGVTFRRWWPIPEQTWPDTATAEAQAARFARDFLDQA